MVQADGAWQIGLAISVLSTIKLGLHLEPFRCRVIGCFLIFVLFPASTAQRILMAIAGFLLPSFPHDPAPYDLGATFHHGGTLATGMAFRPNAGVMPSSNQGGRPASADLHRAPRAPRALPFARILWERPSRGACCPNGPPWRRFGSSRFCAVIRRPLDTATAFPCQRAR